MPVLHFPLVMVIAKEGERKFEVMAGSSVADPGSSFYARVAHTSLPAAHRAPG